MTEFTSEEKKIRAFLRVAYCMQHMWEEDGNSTTNLLNNWLIPDDYVLMGESLNGNECREHVIPRLVICNKCHEMFASGHDFISVSAFIQKHLMIVRISKKERDLLDLNANLGLRTKMPDGWTFENGDPFARLRLANIKLNTNIF